MDIYHIVLGVLCLLLVVFLYQTRKRQIILNRLLSVISKQIVLLENMESVSGKIKNTLMKYLDSMNVSIILYDEEKKDYKFLNPEDVNKGIDNFNNYLKFFMHLESIDSIKHVKDLQKRDDESYVKEGLKYFKDLDAVIVLPLIFERRLIGTINIERKKDKKRYSSFDLDLLENLRPVLSVTFANAMLYSSISKIYEESEERNQALEDIDKAKSAFMSNLSHEIKSPVSKAIKEVDAAGLEDAKRYLFDVQGIISSVFLYSQLQTGRSSLVAEENDIVHLVRECMSEKRPKPGVSMDYDGPESCRFSFDAHKTKQAICQVIFNSVKFTEKGNIIVSVDDRGKDVMVRVDDTGTGIPEDRMDSVFDMFLKPDANRYGGTGLGLALTKKIVELHGGKVSLESRFGEGTTVTMEFPKN